MTLPEKQQFLIDRGYNPAAYDLSDDGQVTKKVVAPQATPSMLTSKSTAGEAFLHGAQRNIGSGLGAAAGTGLGLAGLSWLGGPVTGIPGTLAALAVGAGSGYIGSQIGDAAQKAVTPEETLKRQEAQRVTETAEHPVASFVGEMVPGLSPFGPNVKALGGLSKLARVQGVVLSDAEKAAMIAMAGNAGMGAGFEAGGQAIHGEPIDPVKVALAAAGQGLMSEPNMLGRKIGFHASPTEPDFAPEKMEARGTAAKRLSEDEIAGLMEEGRLKAAEERRIKAEQEAQAMEASTKVREAIPVIEERAAVRTAYKDAEAAKAEAAKEAETARLMAEGRASVEAERQKRNAIEAGAIGQVREITSNVDEVGSRLNASDLPTKSAEASAMDMAEAQRQGTSARELQAEAALRQKAQTPPPVESHPEVVAKTAEVQKLKAINDLTEAQIAEQRRAAELAKQAEQVKPAPESVKPVEPVAPKKGLEGTAMAAAIDEKVAQAKSEPRGVIKDLSISPEDFKKSSPVEKDMLAPALVKELKQKYNLSQDVAEKLIEKHYGYDLFQTAEGKAPKLSDSEAQAAAALAQKRGLPVPKWIKSLETPEGKAARGRINTETGQIDLSLEHATGNTPYHEIAHDWIGGRMDDPRVRKALEANGWDGTAATLKSAEESLVQKLGEEAFNRGKNKSFWGDLKDHIVNRLGMGDEKSANRQLAAKLVEDAPSTRTPRDSGILYSTHDEAAPPEEVKKVRTIPWLESTFDRVRKIRPDIADSADKFYASKNEYVGKFGNTVRHELSKFPKAAVDEVLDQHYKIYHGEMKPEDFSGNSEISDVLKSWATSTAEEQKAAGLKINDRERGVNEYYVPAMLNMETLQKFTNPKYAAEGEAAREAWKEHLVKQGLSEEDAAQHIEDFTNALNSDKSNYRSINFGALRKAAGLGLPEGLRETSTDDVIRRYANRYAADLSFFKHIEQPHAADLGLNGNRPTSLTTNRDVKDMMRWVLNNFETSKSVGQERLGALMRATAQPVMGLGTGLRDFASIPANSLPYMGPVDFVNSAMKAVSNFREHSLNSLKTNARQLNDDRFTWGDLESADKITDRILKVGNMLRLASGREHLERINRTLTYGIGAEYAKSKLMAGDTKFFEKFGLNTEGKSGEELVAQTAKNFTDAVQGSYDGRGLPAWVQDSKLQPFFALSKWSIEKANTINRDVINPMREDGNFVPFLRYTVGSLLTGAAIQELNKVLRGGLKDNEASVKEAQVSGNASDVAHSVLHLAQLGGYVGIISDLAQASSSILVKGKAPQGQSFPLADAFQHGILESAANFRAAVRNGEDPVIAAKELALHFLENHVQNINYATKILNPDRVEEKNARRDYRVYNELTGVDSSVAGKAVNPALNSKEKKFAQTDNISEAADLLPEIISKLVDKFGDNPEKLKQRINSLGESQDSFPNPEKTPITASLYFDHLAKVYGPEEAKNRLLEFYRESALKTAKKSMVPRL